MLKKVLFPLFLALLLVKASLFFTSCGAGLGSSAYTDTLISGRYPASPPAPVALGRPYPGNRVAIREPVAAFPRPRPHTVESRSFSFREINLKKHYMPRNARGRTRRRMDPRYITIHSTQNWSRGADAWRHSLALNRGKLGRISWHFTVDETVAIQHLPTTEQGNHADFDGPGNHFSIGIEMCEHPGNSRARTLNRAAKLTAWLMRKHGIPLHNIKPHYHWPRWGMNPVNKNCPHFLLSNGKPARKWSNFVKVVGQYYNSY